MGWRQCFGSGFIEYGPYLALSAEYWSGSRVLIKKWKNLQLEKVPVFICLKIAIYLSLGLHKGHPSYRSLQPSKKNIHHFQTWNFFTFFYFHFCPPGFGSTDLIESGSNPDPNSKHWLGIQDMRSRNRKKPIPDPGVKKHWIPDPQLWGEVAIKYLTNLAFLRRNWNRDVERSTYALDPGSKVRWYGSGIRTKLFESKHRI